MPANLGYITALLFNQNNCAAEGSTVTTKLEVEVGTDLSVMIGYDKDKCMGHLTAGGSVANIEAVWAARNVKYFPLGLQEALLEEDKFARVSGYKVRIKSKNENKYAIFTLHCVVVTIVHDTPSEHKPSCAPSRFYVLLGQHEFSLH